MLGVVGSSLKMVEFEPTTPNTSQHIAARWPQHVAPNNVAICCVGRLRSFGWEDRVGGVDLRRNGSPNSRLALGLRLIGHFRVTFSPCVVMSLRSKLCSAYRFIFM